jgi:hypothetical protein
VKTVFLDAIPTPYARLTDYAQDLLTYLGLQSGIVVVVTPQQAAAASNRLDSGAIAAIVTRQINGTGLSKPGQLAVGIGQAILQHANDNSRSSTIRSVAAGGVVVLIVLAVLAFSVARIVRRTPPASRRLQRPYRYVATQRKSR